MYTPDTLSLQLKSLSIGYRGKTLAENLQVSAYQGELIALIGSNGAGKSTLLRTLCGLQPKLNGAVEINGETIDALSKRALARQVSMVSTDLIRIHRLKVKDLVLLGRYPHEYWFTKQSDKNRQLMRQALQNVNLLHLYNAEVETLSDGEYQRAMIARALVQDTPLIILDEPTAFLDLPNKYTMVKLLWQLCKKQRKTILFSSHDLNIAMQFADSLWLLHQNNLHTGTPEDLLLNGQIEQLFVDKNLFFDLESSQFKIKKAFDYNIHIEGNGRLLTITKMAIKRLGFNTDCNKKADAVVFTTSLSRGYEWKIKGNNAVFRSIYELQLFLMTLKENH